MSPIYIALAADDNYAQHMAAVILSLLRTTAKPQQLYFFFLDAGIAEHNQRKLQNTIDRHGTQCVFIKPDLSTYLNIPTKRFGVAALLRLALGSLLPDHVERVIYLDCDTLAFDDIALLWGTELDGNTIGAVTNLGHHSHEQSGIPEDEYFNSGILLIDLKQWRNEQIGEKALAYLSGSNVELKFPDQDCLNQLLRGKWKHLPLRWNLQPATFSMHSKGEWAPGLSKDDYEEAICNPGIVHYIGKNKPWDFMSFHPLKENYWAYLADSPWSQSKPSDYSLFNQLKKAVMFEKQVKRLLRRRAIPATVRNKGF